MKINRREFGLYGLMAAIAAAAVGVTGCPSFASIYSTIQAYLPTVITAVENIITMLVAAGIIPALAGTTAAALIDTIKQLVATALQAVQEYENAPPADKTTWLGKLREALAAISDNIASFISGLNLTGNPIAKIIAVLVGIIVSTLNGFIGGLPAPTTTATAKTITPRSSITVGAERVAITPKKRSRSQFVSDWNAACVANGHPEAKLY